MLTKRHRGKRVSITVENPSSDTTVGVTKCRKRRSSDKYVLHPYHQLQATEIDGFRQALLGWFSLYRRKLPWRGDPPPYSSALDTRQIILRRQQPDLTCWFSSNSGVTVKEEDVSALDNLSSCSRNVRPTAYRTWISEVMLQQTQVAVVIPYWLKWTLKWPTVLALAQASEEDVCAVWSGLGYYQRALRLLGAAKEMVVAWAKGRCVDLKCDPHKAAERIDGLIKKENGAPPLEATTEISVFGTAEANGNQMKGSLGITANDGSRIAKAIQQRQGVDWDIPFPRDSVDTLMGYQGIGRYTAGAILSISFGRAVPAVDGNVIRVFSRVLGFAQCPNSPLLQHVVGRIVQEVICPNSPGDFNQALMDLGASVCTPRSPTCNVCPVRRFCRINNEVSQNSLRSERHISTPKIPECTVCLPTYIHSASEPSAYPLPKVKRTGSPPVKKESAECSSLACPSKSPSRVPERHRAFVIYAVGDDTVTLLFTLRPKGLLGKQWGPVVVPQLQLSTISDPCTTAGSPRSLTAAEGFLTRCPHRLANSDLISRLQLTTSAALRAAADESTPNRVNYSCASTPEFIGEFNEEAEGLLESRSYSPEQLELGCVRHVFSHVTHDVSVVAIRVNIQWVDDLTACRPEQYRWVHFPRNGGPRIIDSLGLVSAYMKKIMKVFTQSSLGKTLLLPHADT